MGGSMEGIIGGSAERQHGGAFWGSRVIMTMRSHARLADQALRSPSMTRFNGLALSYREVIAPSKMLTATCLAHVGAPRPVRGPRGPFGSMRQSRTWLWTARGSDM